MIDMYHIGGLFILYSDGLYKSSKLAMRYFRRNLANAIIKYVINEMFKKAMKSGEHVIFCGLDMVIHQVPSLRSYEHDLKFGMKDWEIMLFFNGNKLNATFDESYYKRLYQHIVKHEKQKFYSVYEAAYE